MDHGERLAIRLAALGNATRLSMCRRIVASGIRGATPGDLARDEGIPPNLVSHHLRPLVAAGLLVAEKVGRNIVYRATPAALAEVGGEILDMAARSAR